MPPHFHIGTMGFSYDDWLGNFYPKSAKPADFLRLYSQVFDALELDTTFHAMPPVDRFARWAEHTPDHFRFTLKTPRAITHDNRIDLGIPLMHEFLRRAHTLGEKLACIVIQFGPSFAIDQFDNLEKFLRKLPAGARYAVEFRHRTWLTAETATMLRTYHCAFIAGDYAVQPDPIFNTSDQLYLRLIGIHDTYDRKDHERVDMTRRLTWWRDKITPHFPHLKDVFIFFNNDYAGHSPATANRMKRLLNLPVNDPAPEPQGALF